MILWLIFGLMTAAAMVAVLLPVLRDGAEARSDNDIAVYRDQLDELERDLAAGSIGKTEAEAARVEISRRLLAASDAARAAPKTSHSAAAVRYRRGIAAIALLLLPVGAGGLYLLLGSPELASEPVGAQPAAASNQPSVEELIAKVEAHLARNPDDGRGWEILAPVYMQIGRYSDSVNAWRNVLQLLGDNADREANLGESLTAEANGIVTADAKAAFVRAVTLDSTTVTARYYLGIAAEQDGQRDQAAKMFQDLIDEAPPGAHWVADVRTALARVKGQAPTARPDPAQALAAQQPEQQAAMIRGMVDGLAARLKQDGSDLDGWVKLVRSYKVLGEADKAQAAIGDAQRALAGDAEKRQRLDAALKELDADKGAAVAAVTPPAPNVSPAGAPPQHEGEIRGMVDRLAARLKQSGSDPEGWLMLIRSYLTLGEKEKTTETINSARSALAGDAAKLQLFNEALRRFKVEEPTGATSAATTAPPPAASVEASSPDQTNEMVRSMVARLAERLKQDGSDVDGWMRLVRSYVVLGERDKALTAVADARQAFGTDTDKRNRFDAFVKSLGLEG
ncbi:MAG TPA: c-type cytochrome biogenesis protein CcmI [Pseudolabrys sp.]